MANSPIYVHCVLIILKVKRLVRKMYQTAFLEVVVFNYFIYTGISRTNLCSVDLFFFVVQFIFGIYDRFYAGDKLSFLTNNSIPGVITLSFTILAGRLVSIPPFRKLAYKNLDKTIQTY